MIVEPKTEVSKKIFWVTRFDYDNTSQGCIMEKGTHAINRFLKGVSKSLIYN